MHKLGRSVGNTISLSVFNFYHKYSIKNYFTHTKNVREPWLNNKNFRKIVQISNLRSVHACMNTLSIYSLFLPVVGLINMLWLHGIKTRHKHQKEPDYLKNKAFSKSSNYFWNACKELSKKREKKLNFQWSLPEVFLKNTCVGVSLLTGLPLATLFKKGLRHSCFPITLGIIRTTASEYRNNMPRALKVWVLLAHLKVWG